ncbi:MAG: hypothetical protein KDA44_07730, partial [Planctomycetales bacterium]|nr:hypothetical protein [Planctomycetales bacterium]
MLTLSDVIASGVVPAAVAAVTWWLVRWLRGARDDAAAALPWTIAATAGYLAAEIALRARSMNPAALREAVSELTAPHDAVDWLPAAAVAAMVAGIVIAATNLGRARLAGWAAAVALAAALPWRLLAGSRYLPSQELRDAGFATDAWSLPWAVGVVGAVAAAIVATWIAWQWAPADHLPRLRSALAVVTAVGAAALAGLSGSFSYALSIGAVAASLGGCVAAAWFSRPRTGPGG